MSAPALERAGRVLRTREEALETAHRLAAVFAEGAVRRDQERRLPHAEVDRLKASGLLAIAVPTAYGGPGLPPSVAAEVFAVLASADPNLAQIPHSHFVYLNLVRVAGTEEQCRRLFGRVLDGALLANAQSERGGKTLTDIRTTLSPDGHGALVVEGTKYYCTGTLFADIVPTLTRLDDPRGVSGLPEGDHVVLLDATSSGLAISDDWDAVGQRTTASGTVTLQSVQVHPDQVITRAKAFDDPGGYGAYAQLLHTAIDVGIARGALEAAAEFVRTKSRPWFEAEVDEAVDDPFTVQRFGELAVDVAGADALLERAGRAVDAVFAAPGRDLAAAASLAVAAAKVVGERSSLSVSSGLFEVSGTRSAAGPEALDRYWRNARTHTLHDPVRWKIQHLGRHALTGALPPSHGTI
ncbi:SfnB family sulfur acquisition oxidoreductase [Marmoricola endophyticus]|uniref:SfnB family sulfur acquisition oxidoreductase n=1 Tax=Marmoricola endophyticus TaxID=2040280 RepID=A0A917BLR4_9ACTN|nr:SfnB family sulfur acquisition oxidoreductase [Marmoricola endophyticus]GGF45875.1 SfnB family sulfur acquisition oxidoreductase [Marmoricola endophyticus]